MGNIVGETVKLADYEGSEHVRKLVSYVKAKKYQQCEPLKLVLCERERSRLKSFLQLKWGKQGNSRHYVILEGDYVYMRVTNFSTPPFPYSIPPPSCFLIEVVFVDEFGHVKSFPLRHRPKECLQLVKECVSLKGPKAEQGAIQVVEDEKNQVEKLLVGSFLSNQTTEELRLAMLIAINRAPNMSQQLAKREIRGNFIALPGK